MRKPIIAFFGLFAAVSASAGGLLDRIPDSTYRYNVEAAASLSSGEHTPFWLLNNRFGLSSIEKSNGYLRAGLFKEMKYDRRFSWNFGVDLAVAYNFTSSFIVQQLYAGVRYRSLDLTIGSKERQEGVVNHRLGSGDMVFSENARPVPQIYLSMPDFEPIPGTDKWLSARGYFSMGIFTDSGWSRRHVGYHGTYNDGRWFHTKGLFLRGGNLDKFPITLEGGLEMGTQFGGTNYKLDPHSGQYGVTHFSKSLKNIAKAVLGMGGGNADDPLQTSETSNAYGNHVGQWSLALTYKQKDNPWGGRLYYQHYFDDHSQMFFDHAWRDMLLGVEITFPENPVVSTFVYEYLITKDQSGAVYWDTTDEIPEQVSGADNYYNHDSFGNWQHWGMGIGNPLLISPVYNADNALDFRHNRIKGHHFGWEGHPHPDVDYRVLMSYTRSWGTYFIPTPSIMHNFNALLEVSYRPHRLPGWCGRLSLAADGGRLLGKSFGAMLTISKSGWL